MLSVRIREFTARFGAWLTAIFLNVNRTFLGPMVPIPAMHRYRKMRRGIPPSHPNSYLNYKETRKVVMDVQQFFVVAVFFPYPDILFP